MRYIIHLSNKKEYEIDEDDFQKLKGNMADASMIFLKQVAINPSFMISIEPIPFTAEPKVIVENGRARMSGVTTPKKLLSKWQDNPTLLSKPNE